MKIKSPSESGQALIIIVVAVIGLLGMTALTVDGGNAYSDRRHAQNAADTAVLAGARAKIRNETWKSAALTIASTNGYNNDGTTNTVTPLGCDESGSNCGQYAGNNQYIQVQITSTVKTYFARIINVSQLTNYVSAVAKVIPGNSSPLWSGDSIVGLAPTECKAVQYNGSADVQLIGGGIYSNSNCNNAAFFNNSNSATLSGPSLCTVGGATYNPGAINISNIQSGCAPHPYPDPSFIVPNITCGGQTATQTGSVLSPGNYSGAHFPPNGVTTLQSGVYCVDADFSINGGASLSGSGVVIYMKSGGVTWNGGATINLTAPSSGPYAGLLLYAPYSNATTVSIAGNGSSYMVGSILAPASTCNVLGGGGADGFHTQVVCYDTNIGGSSSTKIVYNSNEQWHAPTPPSMELVK